MRGWRVSAAGLDQAHRRESRDVLHGRETRSRFGRSNRFVEGRGGCHVAMVHRDKPCVVTQAPQDPERGEGTAQGCIAGCPGHEGKH